MNGQRAWWWIVAAAALVAAAWYSSSVKQAEAPAPLEPVAVAFVTGGSGPYWQIAINGAQAAAEEFAVDLDVMTPPGAESLPAQTELLEKVAVSGVRGVAVSPVDAAAQTKLIDELAAKKMHVVTFDSDAPDSQRTGYVGTSNFAAGRVCARLVAEALPGGGKVAVLVANRTKDNLLDRMGGFQEIVNQLAVAQDAAAAAGDDMKQRIEIVDFFVDDGDDEKCATLIRQAIADHPDLACFVGMNARHGPVLMDVLEAEGQLGKIKIVAFDEAAETLAGIESGDVYATVAQDPYLFGYEAVRMLAKFCRGSETEQPIGAATYSVSVETVRKDNLDAHRAKLKARQKDAADAKDAKPEDRDAA